MKLYLIGSLRNFEVPLVANQLRKAGHDVFDDWYAAGPNADDHWRDYEKQRGHSYIDAIHGLAADHVYRFDLKHLMACNAAVLLLPAGKSAHLELGWVLGQGKQGYIILDSPDRWDVMYKFATGIFPDVQAFLDHLS